MSDRSRWAIAIAATIIALAFAAWLASQIWPECRRAGHSRVYCAALVMR